MFKPINLQLFAEEALDNPAPVSSSPAPVSAPAPEGQAAAPLSIDEQLMNLYNSAETEDVQPAITTEPVQPPEATPTQEQLLAGKFKGTGELVRGYENSQSELTKKSQALAEATKAIEALRAQMEVEPPQANPEIPADEFADLDGEAFLEKLYADPKTFLSKFAEGVAKKAIEPYLSPLKPVIEQQKNLESWDKAVNGVLEIDADMAGHIDGMRQYLSDNNLMNSSEPQKVVMKAYIETLKSQAKATADPKTLLANPEFRAAVLSDEGLKNELLKAHMEGIKGNSPPPAITGLGNGQPLATPPAKARTMEDGYAQFESMLNGNFAK